MRGCAFNIPRGACSSKSWHIPQGAELNPKERDLSLTWLEDRTTTPKEEAGKGGHVSCSLRSAAIMTLPKGGWGGEQKKASGLDVVRTAYTKRLPSRGFDWVFLTFNRVLSGLTSIKLSKIVTKGLVSKHLIVQGVPTASALIFKPFVSLSVVLELQIRAVKKHCTSF